MVDMIIKVQHTICKTKPSLYFTTLGSDRFVSDFHQKSRESHLYVERCTGNILELDILSNVIEKRNDS